MVLTKEVEMTWVRKTKNYFIERGYKFTGFGSKLLVNFEDIPHGSDKWIDIQCDYCGQIFKKQIKKYYKGLSIIQKDCCMECRTKKSMDAKMERYGTLSAYVNGYTVEQFKEARKEERDKIFDQIKKIFSEKNYTLVSDEYINNHTKIKYICNKHADKGEQGIDWIHLKDGRGCYYCGRESMMEKIMHSYDEVKKMIESNGKNKLLSLNYTGYSDYNLKITCEECGNVYTTSLGIFMQGHTRCKACTCSKGERAIIDYLTSNHIKYNHEYEIISHEWENPLRLDFYLEEYNFAIEYDGEQHFKPINFDGKSEEEVLDDFYSGLKRDKIKNNYCVSHNILLMRIPYWERENINTILDEYFLYNKNDFIIEEQKTLITLN